MYFLIGIDVIFAQLHQKRDNADLIKYVVTPKRVHAQDVSLTHVVKTGIQPPTYQMSCLCYEMRDWMVFCTLTVPLHVPHALSVVFG